MSIHVVLVLNHLYRFKCKPVAHVSWIITRPTWAINLNRQLTTAWRESLASPTGICITNNNLVSFKK